MKKKIEIGEGFGTGGSKLLAFGCRGGEKRWKERKWKKDFFSGHTGIKKHS